METTRFRGQTLEDAVAAACTAHGAEADIVATQLVSAPGLRGLMGLREVVTLMLENGVNPGLVVNISSITGAGNPGQGNYAAAKAGLDAATRTWALELAQHGIRVGGIAPGLIDTPMAAGLAAAARTEMIADVPLGRMGRPEEIWAALRFIVECDFFTGRVVLVDGGASYS